MTDAPADLFALRVHPTETMWLLAWYGTADVGAIIADQIAQLLEARTDARLMALDFKGTFNKIWWRVLLEHFCAVGVGGRAEKLFESCFHLTELSVGQAFNVR